MNAQQLRSSILKHALEGKLVPQNFNDLSVFENIDKVQVARTQAIKNKIMRNEQLAPIDNKENAIPKNWTLVRLPYLCLSSNGAIRRGPFGSSITKSMFVPPTESTYKVYEQGNAIRKTTEYGNYYITEKDFSKLMSFEVFPGDIIISCAGTIGEAYIIPETAPKGIINQALMKLTINEEVIDKEFFLLAFKYLVNDLKKNAKGSAIKNLSSLKYLKNEVAFPLPPLEEQQRIVAKVKILNEKTDDYNALYERNKSLVFMFPSDLEKSILQYAMQGKLVQQNFSEEPASVLIGKIKKEKEELIKQKVIKKEKELEPISQEEIPHDIPDTWEWIRIKDVYYNKGQKKPDKEFCYIDVGCIDNKNGVITNSYSTITPDKAPSRARKIVEQGNIIYSTVRPYLQNIAIVDKEFEKETIASTAFVVMNPIQVDTRYLFYVLKSPYFNRLVESKMVGATYPAINDTNFNNLVIPLPPFEEQIRIVLKIEELLLITKDLKSKTLAI